MSKSKRPSSRHGDYDIGYGRPPKANQFKRGQSGNPKGRPRGAKNFDTLLIDALAVRVPVTEQGQIKHYTKAELITLTAVNQAVKGDHRARKEVLEHVRRIDAVRSRDTTDEGEIPLPPEDREVIDGLAMRLRRTKNAAASDARPSAQAADIDTFDGAADSLADNPHRLGETDGHVEEGQ